MIPLAASGSFAIASTLAIAGFLALRWHLSILVQNLATMLGLGLGIDYALLIVSRFREAICAGHNGFECSSIASRQASRTLLISASTVAIGFLALLTVPISEVSSIGLAGFLVAGISVLLSITLVPAVLALLEKPGGLTPGGYPSPRGWTRISAARTGERWRKWGKVIVAHPLGRHLALAGGPFASARVPGGEAGYQRSQRGLASARGGIRFTRFTPFNKWTALGLFNRCALF